MQNQRTPYEWTLFLVLSLIWAGAYGFTRMAVSPQQPSLGFPPSVVIVLRLTLGGAILLLFAAASRQPWPPLRQWKDWTAMAVMGILGTAAPFYLITTAQRTVDSGLAALYVAVSPLFVAVLAHFAFQDDRLSARKTIGILVGFCGVGVLFGPEAVTSFGSASVTAQALCLLATFFYAVSTITARYARNIAPSVFSAGFVCFGAAASWPLLLMVDLSTLTPSRNAIIGIAGLAIGPTALASMLYMVLISRTSATFLSLTGYAIPFVSALIGYVVFGETHGWDTFAALVIILAGVWLAQRGGAESQRGGHSLKAGTGPRLR